MDLHDDSFTELCEFQSNSILTDNIFKKNIIRATQYKPEVFVGNLVKFGIQKNTLKIEKQILTATKKFKFKG